MSDRHTQTISIGGEIIRYDPGVVMGFESLACREPQGEPVGQFPVSTPTNAPNAALGPGNGIVE